MSCACTCGGVVYQQTTHDKPPTSDHTSPLLLEWASCVGQCCRGPPNHQTLHEDQLWFTH